VSAEAHLHLLRQRYLEARRQGRAPTPQELCLDCPAWAPLVEQYLPLWGLDGAASQGSWSLPVDDASPPGMPSPQPAPPARLEPGAELVPGYRLVAFRGRGSFGEVWQAAGPGNVPCALKVIPLGAHAAGEVRALDLMRQLRHAHLLTLTGYWQLPGTLVIALELADGTLLDRLRECRAQGLPGIPRDALLEHLRDAARGIDYLNQAPRNIQHRDIKPGNLMLVGGCVKVGDFGLAKIIEQTRSGHTAAFTVAYAAPESFQSRVTHTSDQYSLAVTYCELRGGRLPFVGDPAALVGGHLTQPPDLSMLPEAERPVVARALAKDPEQRWPSCRAFVDALANTVSTPPEATRGQTERQPPLPPQHPNFWNAPTEIASTAVLSTTDTLPAAAAPPGRPRPVVVVVVLLGLVVLSGLVWWFTAGQAPRDDTKGGLSKAVVPKKDSPSPPPAKPPPELTNSLGIRFALVPRGTFWMGGSGGKPGDRQVEIPHAFYLGVHEVTQAQWQAVMGTNPSAFSRTGEHKNAVKDISDQDLAQFPVERVSWEDIQVFLKKLNALEKASGWVHRLPTEAEWEHAARGAPSSREECAFDFYLPKPSNDLSALQSNFHGSFPAGKAAQGPCLMRTTRVGSYPPNRLGIHDMHGNVWEWCEDAFGKGSDRVIRGGGWHDNGVGCRAASRVAEWPGRHYYAIGFRLARARSTK
jgi:formylglycine-generating enzyme required for sulfatase activity